MHGSYSKIGDQILFIVTSYSVVVSNDSGSKLRLEQVRSLEGNCDGQAEILSSISSVQEDVAASGEIQNEDSTIMEGIGGAGVPWGCRRGRVVANADVEVAKLISETICPVLDVDCDRF